MALLFWQEEVAKLQGSISEEETAIDGLKQVVDRLSAQVEGRLSFEFKVSYYIDMIGFVVKAMKIPWMRSTLCL